MQIELLICKRNIPAVPAIVLCCGAAEEQDRAAVWIKDKQYSHRIAFELDSQLLHVLVRRALNVINPGPSQIRPHCLQHLQICENFVLQFLAAFFKPGAVGRPVHNRPFVHPASRSLTFMILHTGYYYHTVILCQDPHGNPCRTSIVALTTANNRTALRTLAFR